MYMKKVLVPSARSCLEFLTGCFQPIMCSSNAACLLHNGVNCYDCEERAEMNLSLDPTLSYDTVLTF